MFMSKFICKEIELLFLYVNMTVILKSEEIDRSRGDMSLFTPTPVSSIILVLYLFSAEFL